MASLTGPIAPPARIRAAQQSALFIVAGEVERLGVCDLPTDIFAAVARTLAGGIGTMNDQYTEAYRFGGATGVNRLLEKRFPDDQTRIGEINRMEETGDWEVEWHYSSRSPTREKEKGVVKRYVGDE